MNAELIQRLEATTANFAAAIHDATPGRIDHLDDEMATYLTALRDVATAARSAIERTTGVRQEGRVGTSVRSGRGAERDI